MDDELLSTGAVARRLGCSRQHVVDLCTSGRLPCVSVGTHRRVRRADLDRFMGRFLTRDQERSVWLHSAVAGRLVADPDSVLERAADNLRDLRLVHARGVVTRSLDDWGDILAAGPLRTLEALTSRELWAVELRQNSPFAGVLTADERKSVLDAFREHWRRSRTVRSVSCPPSTRPSATTRRA
jgi:excisionase family DNA binding protein